jgi:glutaredoxin 3
MASPADRVQSLISREKVVIFAKPTCPFCTRARSCFEKISQPFVWVDLTAEKDGGTAIQAYLGELTGAKTVPRVFVQGKCIGGGSETEQLYNAGVLQQLLS